MPDQDDEVSEMAIRRTVAIVGAVAVEALLILSVVLSSIGVAPGARPTPAGAMVAPITSR
jgi:hypothetical protein